MPKTSTKRKDPKPFTNRATLAKAREALKAMEKREAEIIEAKYLEEGRLRDIASKTLVLVILEEKLLHGLAWTIQDDTHATLFNAGPAAREDALLELLETKSWHGSLSMQDGVELSYNDGNISLRFENFDIMRYFCELHGLVFDADAIVSRKNDLAKQVAVLTGILDKIHSVRSR